MRMEKQVEYRESGRARLRAAANRAMRECQLQGTYLIEREAIIASLPEFPRSIRLQVREYGDGYITALTDHNVVFLYCVDGQLYRLTNENRSELAHLPAWDTLPREGWNGMFGTLYWVNGGKPLPF